MQDSLWEPTPTPPAKSRSKPQKRWEILWTRSCECGSSTKNGWNFLPRSIQPFSFISACGSRCGSRQKADRTKPDHRKKQLETLSEISVLICRQAQISFALRFDCPYPAQKNSQQFSYMQQKPCIFMQGFVNGGGEWIRTTEVVDNRFTVCPLWPLGNSPINYAILYKACPAFLSGRTAQFGAGERTRTPDLLITNQLLYQLSYTSSSLSARLL